MSNFSIFHFPPQATGNGFSSTLRYEKSIDSSEIRVEEEQLAVALEGKCKKIKFIAIEGNIGAGKSTLFNNIQGYINEYELNKDNHIIFLREPVDLWENVKNTEGKNMLELFYENPDKYAFDFQIMALTVQIKLIDETLEKNPQCTIIVSERSFTAGHNVFTKMLHDNGKISSIQYEIYKLLLKTRTESSFVKHTGVPDKIIYLNIPANICKKRIGNRKRGGEELISLEYLQKCEKYYKDWLFSEEGANNELFRELYFPSQSTENGSSCTLRSGENVNFEKLRGSLESRLEKDQFAVACEGKFSTLSSEKFILTKNVFVINNNEDIQSIVLQIIG